jgi:hypothetical protein
MKSIRSIATKVRKQCEIFAYSNNARGYDFYKSNDLACMCAVASYTLALRLRKNGIPCKVIYGKFDRDEHCWVETKKYIVDITASQFGMADVYIISKTEDEWTEIYMKRKVARSYKSLQWSGQAPTPNLSRTILSISA